MTLFLQDVCAEDTIQIGDKWGLMLVLELLQDKLEIGMGRYHFPLCTPGDYAPALVERDE